MNRYTVYIIPRAWKEIKDLPGNMRNEKKHRMNSVFDTRNPFKRVTTTTRARRTRFNVFPVPGREFIRGRPAH